MNLKLAIDKLKYIKNIALFTFLSTSLLGFMATSAFALGAEMALQVTPKDIEEVVKKTMTSPCVNENVRCYAINTTRIKSLDTAKKQITFLVEVNTQPAQLVTLPISMAEFNIEEVRINGQITHALAVMGNSYLGVLATNGISGKAVIELEAKIKAGANTFTLPSESGFIDVSAVSDKVKISVLNNGNKIVTLFKNFNTPSGSASPGLNGNLNNGENPGSVERLSSVDVEPFILIERRLSMGDTVTLDTSIQTQNTPTLRGTKTIRLDSLPGEQITSNTASIVAGKIMIEYVPLTTMGYTSIVKSRGAEFKNTTPYMEKIILMRDSSWRTTESGVDAVHKNQYQTQWWLAPGQTLKIEAQKTTAATAVDSAIEKSVMRAQFGGSVPTFNSTITLNSSAGSKIFLNNQLFSEFYDITNVMLNNQKIIFNKSDKRTVIVPNLGENTISVGLSAKNADTQIVQGMPKVEFVDEDLVPISSRNYHTTVESFSNKWLLFTYGSDIRPSILLWGIIIFISIASFSLGKFAPYLTLSIGGWFILLSGLTQAGWVAIWAAISWFILLYIRRNYDKYKFLSVDGKFNTFQILLAFMTLVLCSTLFNCVSSGLLGSAQVFIEGFSSTSMSLYFYNQSDAQNIKLIWLPVWVYRALMFIWSIWLAVNVLKWAQVFWESYSMGGIWKKHTKIARDTAPI